MASEYLKWKARDVKPDAPPPPMTRTEKLKNWFYYHKWWLLAGAVLLWILGSILWNALGIGQVKPDYRFAYVGAEPLADGTAAALEQYFTTLADDRNGDGQVKIELRQYALSRTGDAETSLYYNYAADTVLVADITAGESYFFLTETPDALQRAYEIFAAEDGTPAEKGEICVYALKNVPETLYIGRRCFYGDMAAGHEAEAALWAKIAEALT